MLLVIKLWESGVAPSIIIAFAVIVLIDRVVKRLTHIDPELMDAFTRWRITGRLLPHNRGSITVEQAKEILELLSTGQGSEEEVSKITLTGDELSGHRPGRVAVDGTSDANVADAKQAGTGRLRRSRP